MQVSQDKRVRRRLNYMGWPARWTTAGIKEVFSISQAENIQIMENSCSS